MGMKFLVVMLLVQLLSLSSRPQPLYIIVKEIRAVVEKNGGSIRMDIERKTVSIEILNGKIGTLFVKIWPKNSVFSKDSVDFIVDRSFDGIIDFATNPSKQYVFKKNETPEVRRYFYEAYRKTLTEILKKRGTKEALRASGR